MGRENREYPVTGTGTLARQLIVIYSPRQIGNETCKPEPGYETGASVVAIRYGLSVNLHSKSLMTHT